MPFDRKRFLPRSLEAFQSDAQGARSAAAASYTLIGAILLLGGIGYGVDRWQGSSPWGVLVGLLCGVGVGFYELRQISVAPMKVLLRMVIASLAGWLVVAVADAALTRDVFFGMLGPLVAASVTWLLVERTARMNPAGLTQVMMSGFVVKMLFFGVYVVVVLRALDVGRVPFALSFTTYFISLYAAEAVLMRRLFSRTTAQPS